MGSVLAEIVVKNVCEMAIRQAANGMKVASNFTEDLESVKNRAEEINRALSEADEVSAAATARLRTWLHKVRDIAWEVEDILQECAVDSMDTRNTQLCSLPLNQLIFRRKMDRRIQKVKARMSSVVKAESEANIVRPAVPRIEEAAEPSSGNQPEVPPKEDAESSRRSQTRQLKKWTPAPSEPVGIQSKIHDIARLLEDPQIPIIAVVGMRGVGKTYLLQHVYHRVKVRYEKSAWLSVSQFYSISTMQNDLALQLDEYLSREIKESGIMLAGELIYRFMKEKRCLVVLDDVLDNRWTGSKESNLITELGIPIGDDTQCKILLSTRNSVVTRNLKANLKAETYDMGILTDEESWRLFCAHAFPRCEGNKPPKHLEEVGFNIVKECWNLPIAIKTTAASLSSTTLLVKWQSKLRKLKQYTTDQVDPLMYILKFTYDALPHLHLKDAFAYLSFFPEDEQIDCEYLIYLWVAEGFVPARENAWDCLYQLADLGLLDIWEEWNLRKYCKLHDLLVDVAIQISRENKCAFGLEEVFCELGSAESSGDRWGRLFLAKKHINAHAISQLRPTSPTIIRTLSLSRNSEIGEHIPATLFSGMRVLRVLDLSHTNISTLPPCVGKMKLLKILNLSSTRIQKVPDCVMSLKSLSYLNVSLCSELEQSRAPQWMSELRYLQHLEGPFKQMPKGISKLESLHTLRISRDRLSLSMEENGLLRLEDFGKMSQLEEIDFQVEDESQLKKMEEGILLPLLNMRRLTVFNAIRAMPGETELRQFPERMSAMRDLEHLSLYDFAVPSWICYLENLTYLFLCNCYCSIYPELQAMPNLVSLMLMWNNSCRGLPETFGKLGGFLSLRFLWVEHFTELEEFPEIEEGAMACLEKLHILDCEKVNKIGGGLERLKNLKEFRYSDTGTAELRESLKEGGIYWRNLKANNSEIQLIE